MKKGFLILLATCALNSTFAQTEKGKMLLGGQLSFSGNNQSSSLVNEKYDSDIKTSSFSLEPSFGYFVKDNLAIGVDLGFGSTTTNSESSSQLTSYNDVYNMLIDTKEVTKSYGVGVFARQYLKMSNKFMFYVNGGVGYSVYNTDVESTYTDTGDNPYNDNEYKMKAKVISIDIQPGIIYFPTPKLGFHATIGSLYYQSRKRTDNNIEEVEAEYKQNNYGINLNLASLQFGASYHF